jgi:hypothetical protein
VSGVDPFDTANHNKLLWVVGLLWGLPFLDTCKVGVYPEGDYNGSGEKVAIAMMTVHSYGKIFCPMRTLASFIEARRDVEFFDVHEQALERLRQHTDPTGAKEVKMKPRRQRLAGLDGGR